MTPRFDEDSVQAKLALLRSVLADLDSLGAVTTERLQVEPAIRGATERFLSQLVDLAVSVNAHVAATLGPEAPTDYYRSFSAAAEAGALPPALAAELAPSAGMRNIIVHEYARLDLRRLADAVPEARDGYRRYVEAVAVFLRKRAKDEEGG
jgi:uncharacterized protein YutE (UPF0331/DUF86 family)